MIFVTPSVVGEEGGVGEKDEGLMGGRVVPCHRDYVIRHHVDESLGGPSGKGIK